MQIGCSGSDDKKCSPHKLMRNLVLPGLVVLQVSIAGISPSVAQPPDPGTVNVAYLDPAIEAEWKRLREAVSTQEISAPQETIKRYQQFYEQRGARSLVTAIKISRLIAQIYWQKLNNREKALEIYDWALKTYGDLPHVGILKTERDLVANTPSLQSLVSVTPLSVGGLEEETAGPISLTIKVPAPGPSALPQNIGITPDAGLSPVSNMPGAIRLPGQDSITGSSSTTPGQLRPIGQAQDNDTQLPQPFKIGVGNRSASTAPLAVPIPSIEQQDTSVSIFGITNRLTASSPSLSAISLPAGVAGNPFSIAPLTATGIPQAPSLSQRLEVPSVMNVDVTLQTPTIPTSTMTVATSASSINPRLTALTGYITQWQEGRLSWEEVLKTANFTADDIILLTSQRGVVSMGNSGGGLREKLGEFIYQSPPLMERWETLPVPAQVALAEHYKRLKDPLSVKIYQHLLSQEVPVSAWWTKELLMYRFAEYYAAQGDYVKAAEVNIEIASVSKHPDWKSDSYIVAARYYRQAGQDEKANELYKRAEVGARAWALGILRYDQARILIAQDKHEEARKLLMLPLEGSLSEQVQIVVWALLGYSYYQTGELELARKYSQDAVNQSQRFIQLLANEGLEQQVAFAKRTLQYLDQWQKAPLLAQPASLTVALTADHPAGEAFRFPFGVQSRSRVPLTVKSDNPTIKMYVDPPERAADQGHYFETMIIATLSAETVTQLRQGRGNVEFKVEVKSLSHPDVILSIPVVVKG